MAYIADASFDAMLNDLQDNADALHICSQEPTTLAEAETTYKLGTKTTPTISEPADRTGGGRKVTVSAITDGTVSSTGTATHWAIVDAGVRLLATGSLSSPQSVTSGNPFTLTAFDIGTPDAVNE